MFDVEFPFAGTFISMMIKKLLKRPLEDKTVS
jgi:hypothetical protein